MQKTIRFNDIESGFEYSVVAERIVYLSKKDEEGDITIVHLDTGEKLETDDSINTIEARINLLNE